VALSLTWDVLHKNFMKSVPIWSSTFYFLFYAAAAALIPFLALYYEHLGLSGGQIGLLLGISPLITLFAAPFWTSLADVKHRHKTVLTVAMTAVVVVMLVFPSIKKPALLFLAVSLFALFSASIIPLMDSATMSMLGGQKDQYGRIRLWGTIGWGVTAPIAGAVLQGCGLQWSFWIYAALMFVALFVGRQLIFAPAHTEASFRHGVRTLLTDRRWVLFLLMVFMTGIGSSAISTYLSVLMESMKATKTLIGLALTVSTISELPIMFFSNLLLRRLKARGLLILAMAIVGIRCLLYYFVNTSGGVLAIQLLHGLTFPILWVAGVTHAAESAPAGLGATAQGVFSGTLLGFGAAAGSLLGGILIDRLGPAGMFGVIGWVVLSSLVVFLFFERKFIRVVA